MKIDEKPIVLLVDENEAFCVAAQEAFEIEGQNVIKFPRTFEEVLKEIHERETQRVVLIVDHAHVSGASAILGYVKSISHCVMSYVLSEDLTHEIFRSALRRGAYNAFDKRQTDLSYLVLLVNESPVWDRLGEKLTDEMTGLDNYAGFQHTVTYELETMRVGRREGLLNSAVLVMDADHFKQVNDTHGHLMGDDAIRLIAKTLQNNVRPSDHLCHKSGDEFLVWLRGADKELATVIGRKLQIAVSEAMLYGQEGERIRLGISFGVSEIKRHEIDADSSIAFKSLIESADKVLNNIKSARPLSMR